jgi:predicted nucleic acid-binding protein
MAANPKKSLALDTNILLDLAESKDFAHEFKEEFLSRGYSLLVPPTVIAELAFFAGYKNLAQRELADIALEKLVAWRCQPFTLSSVQMLTAARFAARLAEAPLLPETEHLHCKLLGHFRQFASVAGRVALVAKVADDLHQTLLSSSVGQHWC